jgi:hypothetical protein
MKNLCLPPEEYRKVDRVHWLQKKGQDPIMAMWADTEDGFAWIDFGTEMSYGPGHIARAGFFYREPVLYPDEVAALREANNFTLDLRHALEDLIDVQTFSKGWDNGVTDSTGMTNEAEYFHGQAMDRATAALKKVYNKPVLENCY